MESYYLGIAIFTSYFALGSALLSLLIYRRLNAVLRVFAVYVVTSGSFDILSNSFANVGMNNLPLLHLFTLMEVILLGTFFKGASRSLSKSRYWYPLMIVLAALVVLNSMFVQSINTFNSYAAALCSIFVILGCITYFYDALSTEATAQNHWIKWLCIGLLIYHVTALVVISASNLMVKLDPEYTISVWLVRAVIILLTKVIFVSILVKAYFSTKQRSSYA